MSAFISTKDLPVRDIWTGITARMIVGKAMTFAVVDLAPGTAAKLHHHTNEQMGIVLKGQMTFTVAGETRVLVAGDTYNIPSDAEHEAIAGPEGAVVIDVFSPVREEWNALPETAPRPIHWP